MNDIQDNRKPAPMLGGLLPNGYGDDHLRLLDAVREADLDRLRRDIAEIAWRHGLGLEFRTEWSDDEPPAVTVQVCHL